MRTFIATLVIAGSLVMAVVPASGQEEKQGPFRLIFAEDGQVTWKDQQGEASYHVSGNVDYQPPPTCIGGLGIPGEALKFDEMLPADTTRFMLPGPSDERLTWRKEWEFKIDALDSAGDTLVLDGTAFNADKFCTPEEIAAELAAAGGGPSRSNGPSPLGFAALAALGAALVAAGFGLRRMA